MLKGKRIRRKELVNSYLTLCRNDICFRDLPKLFLLFPQCQ